ncbi:MAG: L,D-transpeptidase [Anaerolineales bacterium]|nr:L,D-transpeptidase [Anaerolineales bacterium]
MMSKNKQLTRKGFLKLSGLGLLGLSSPGLSPLSKLFSGQQGRVIYENIGLFQKPSFESKRLRLYWKDTVLPIAQVRIGGTEPEYNRVWYRIGREGYVHSGGVQPVRTQTNPVISAIPAGGALAEVTVPYTDALWTPGASYHVAYRFYYETTHWIAGLVLAQDGTPYYHILEDKWDLDYYVPAAHLRVLPPEELSLISPHVPHYAKRIEVRTDLQVVIAYEWNEPVFMVKAATGADFSTGKYITPPGRHLTNYKRPSRHMAAGNLAYNGYDLPGVPWISYITESGIALHGTYWHNDFGKARSHGCINLPSRASQWLYRWSLPQVPAGEQSTYDKTGTIVDVIPRP